MAGYAGPLGNYVWSWGWWAMWVMSWGGLKPLVGPWGSLKYGMGAYGGQNRKFVFSAIFDHFMVACRVTVWGHDDEGQHGSCHGVVSHLLMAHGARLSIEWGLMEAKIKNMCLLQFLVIFGHRWVAMTARGTTVWDHGDRRLSGTCDGVAGHLSLAYEMHLCA
jgi:hypothetical protein